MAGGILGVVGRWQVFYGVHLPHSNAIGEIRQRWHDEIAALSAILVRYHSGGSMKLNACILLLAHIVYL